MNKVLFNTSKPGFSGQSAFKRVSQSSCYSLLILIFTSIILVCSIHQSEAGIRDDFSDLYTSKKYKEKRNTLKSKVFKGKIENLKFILVKGFLNEGIPGYFTDNVNTLKFHGVPQKNIFVIEPPSKMTPKVNTASLKKIVKSIKGELVLIGHSKGAMEILALLLTQSIDMNRIKMTYLIQGPFYGTPLTELLQGNGKPVSKSVPLKQRLDLKLLTLGGKALNSFLKNSMDALSTSASKKFWDTNLTLHSNRITDIKDKIIFITSHESPKDNSFAIDSSAWYLETSFGPNDGLLLEKDQFVSKIGAPKESLLAGHLDLAMSWPLSRKFRKFRSAFTEAVLMDLTR